MVDKTDIIIVGGGIVGMSCALAIADRVSQISNAPLSIKLIDAAVAANDHQPAFDGRASAIAAASFRMFEALGLGSLLEGQTQPILDILISDGETGHTPSPLTLHFDGRQLQDPDAQLTSLESTETDASSAMGYMIENRHLLAALCAKIAQTDSITLLAPAKVTHHETHDDGVTITLNNGKTLSGRLLIAADGRGSLIRKRAGIDVVGWEYGQKGIVTTVSHQQPHHGVAHELFLPAGPFAILPLPDADGLHRSSIVWSDSARAADAAAHLPDDLFEAELARRFGNHWGEVNVIAKRHIYPLGLQMAKDYIKPRIALVGDSAHAIHPIAGQGLNMGLRDIAALADVISKAVESKADIGLEASLEEYALWRKFDNQALAIATDIFNRVFSNNISPVKHARRLGLAAIDKISPARSFFMKEASGQTGELPTLLR